MKSFKNIHECIFLPTAPYPFRIFFRRFQNNLEKEEEGSVKKNKSMIFWNFSLSFFELKNVFNSCQDME